VRDKGCTKTIQRQRKPLKEKEYFESDEEVWPTKLDELKKFIIDNN
jgi:hypothetical protein